MRLAGLYPNLFGNDKLIWTGYSWFVIVIQVLFMSCLIGTCYRAPDAFLFTQSIHYTGMFMCYFSISVSNNYHRRQIIKVIEYIGSGFYRPNALSHEKRKELDYDVRRFALAVTVSIGFLGLINLFGNSHGVKEPLVDDGIERTLPLPMWVPWNTKNMFGYIVALIFEGLATALFSLCIINFNLHFFAISSEFCSHLDFLYFELVNMKKRVNDKESDRKLIQKMYDYKSLVKQHAVHHQNIVKCFLELKLWNRSQICVNYTLGAVVICISAIVLSEKDIDTLTKLFLLMTLAGEMIHLGSYCFLSQRIINKSERLAFGIFMAPWMDMGKSEKSTLLIMMLRCQTPLAMSLMGVITVGMNSYADIIRSAYSFFNVVHTMQG